jgi:hypothetical protein
MEITHTKVYNIRSFNKKRVINEKGTRHNELKFSFSTAFILHTVCNIELFMITIRHMMKFLVICHVESNIFVYYFV